MSTHIDNLHINFVVSVLNKDFLLHLQFSNNTIMVKSVLTVLLDSTGQIYIYTKLNNTAVTLQLDCCILKT